MYVVISFASFHRKKIIIFRQKVTLLRKCKSPCPHANTKRTRWHHTPVLLFNFIVFAVFAFLSHALVTRGMYVDFRRTLNYYTLVNFQNIHSINRSFTFLHIIDKMVENFFNENSTFHPINMLLNHYHCFWTIQLLPHFDSSVIWYLSTVLDQEEESSSPSWSVSWRVTFFLAWGMQFHFTHAVRST